MNPWGNIPDCSHRIKPFADDWHSYEIKRSLAEKSPAGGHFFDIRERGILLHFFDQIRLSRSLSFALYYSTQGRLWRGYIPSFSRKVAAKSWREYWITICLTSENRRFSEQCSKNGKWGRISYQIDMIKIEY
jgi:hypothetical protein